MVKGYDQLRMNDLRDDSERIMRKNFPNSVYTRPGARSAVVEALVTADFRKPKSPPVDVLAGSAFQLDCLIASTA